MKETCFSKKELVSLLSIDSQKELDDLFAEANRVAEKFFDKKVFYRGLLEFSNHCSKDCYYCGLRKSNSKVQRYKMPADQILEIAHWAHERGYGSLTLQSGEVPSPKRIQFIIDVIKKIKAETTLGLTLSFGELPKEVYQELFDAGGHRYLLRIETSNPTLYAKLHPEDHSFEQRLNCLKDLQEIGFQTGTGVMIGLPFQTIEDLADDLLFFKNFNIDMIGMGPYIPHSDTPLGNAPLNFDEKERLSLSLKMVAIARLFLQDVNIAATTALQALHPRGRELAMKAGANILMPIITPMEYREHYLIYEGKPCVNESAAQCQGCLTQRLKWADKEMGINMWGDSPHYFSRKQGTS